MRKIYTENLNKKLYKGREVIDWKNNIGNKIWFIYDSIEDYIILKEVNNRILTIYNNTYGLYKIRIDSFLKCSLKSYLKLKTSSFKIEIGEVLKDNNRDLTIVDRKYIEKEYIKNGKKYIQKFKYYKYVCNKCGFNGQEHYFNKKLVKDYWVEESSLLKKKIGCSCCCESPLIVVENINSIVSTEEWMVSFFQGGYNEAKQYTSKSSYKIQPICPKCGKVKEDYISICDIYRNKSIGCECDKGASYPEKFMMALLNECNISYIKEYSPKWLKGKRYDFYIPSKSLIIEMDGGWHFKNNSYSGQTKEESQYIDNIKNKLAQKHRLNIIRINCNYKNDMFEYIKNNILDSELNKILVLNNINWNQIKNIIIKKYYNNDIITSICNYYNDTKESTTNISKIFNINRTTVKKYLLIGAEKNICDYNTEEVKKERKVKMIQNAIKSNNKPISVYKDNNFIKNFESIKELKEYFLTQSIILHYRYIKKSILDNKPYKGYNFKYVNTEVSGLKD